MMENLDYEKLKLILLQGGEEIVGFVVDETDDHLVVSNPFKVYIETNLETKKQLIYLFRWLAHSDETEFVIEKKHIFLITYPNIVLINLYEEELSYFFDNHDDQLHDFLSTPQEKKSKMYKEILLNHKFSDKDHEN